MRQWFFTRQGQTKGPYTDEQLRALARSGQLLPDDLLSYTGANKWIPARQVPNLFSAATPTAPPAPTPAEAPRSLLEPLLALPKPLLFAIFGGIGGLLGALVLGEVLWALLSPASFRPPQPQVHLGIPSTVRVYVGGKNRFVVKLSREGFQGRVRIESEKPPEGIQLSEANIPEDGDEAKVEVQTAANLRPGTYSLMVWGRAPSGEGVRDGHGTIELSVKPVPTKLRLAVPPEIVVYQGGKAQFHIKLARHRFRGPVKLRFQGLPESIALPDTTVDEDRSEAAFTVQAPETSKPGEWPVALLATQQGGKAREMKTFKLRVRLLPPPKADIVFVLDLTGSMQFAIDGIKLGIQNFVSSLKKSRIDARIALVGFRDIQADGEQPFVMRIEDKAFTKDYEAFKTEVGKLRARGGGDQPESSLQALALAAKQPFRANASSVLLLITDAPPKNHPAEKPSTVEETLGELEKNKINQLHLVVRPSDNEGDYAKFRPTLPGKFFDLSRSTSGNAFRDILPKLSREISTTIAAKPRKLEEAAALPDLAVESQAPPPLPVDVVVVKAVQSTQAYKQQDRHRLLLAIAVWTMAISGLISLFILGGQRYYACRRFAGLVEGSKSMGGGFLAGLAGGAAGQLLFQNTAGGTAWEVASRLLGWGLLGGLIGCGMSFFVPNLK
ncbi:MAG: GYF domain-containing protein, partial [Gemmataceae bacterium]